MTKSRRVQAFLLVVLLAGTGLVTTATPSEAACSGVSYPRVRYWCDTVAALTSYTNNNTAGKNHNSMFEGGSLPVGIYLQTRTNKFHIVNASGFAYKSFERSTARAYCWNRSQTNYSSARCDFVIVP